MKILRLALYHLLLAAIRGHADQTNGLAVASPTRYYIHVFSGWIGIGTNTPPTSVTPPHLTLSTNIQFGKGFAKEFKTGGPPLSGYIEARGDKYFLHTRAEGNWDWADYVAEIELEKPFMPASKPMTNAVNSLHTFVLSTNSSYKPFLENLAANSPFK
jgi:hypothetical protein